MIPLPSEFIRKGFTYKLVKRWDCEISKKGIAILSQHSDGNLVAFEVIRIQKQFEDQPGPAGVIYKAKERVPSDGMWGTDGWTISIFGNTDNIPAAIERAEKRFNQLKEKIENTNE
jgi:hypothetical protein